MTDDEGDQFGADAGGGYEWEDELDLTGLSEEELRARLKELAEEERVLSYRRRVVQGRIDLLRGELVRRGGVALSPEDLARVLLGDEGGRGGEATGGPEDPRGGRRFER